MWDDWRFRCARRRPECSLPAGLQPKEQNCASAGGTDILMNNAGIQPGSQMFGPHENWQRILSVDLWGVINGSQVFAPQIIARGLPGSGTADLANQRSGDHSTWSR